MYSDIFTNNLQIIARGYGDEALERFENEEKGYIKGTSLNGTPMDYYLLKKLRMYYLSKEYADSYKNR